MWSLEVVNIEDSEQKQEIEDVFSGNVCFHQTRCSASRIFADVERKSFTPMRKGEEMVRGKRTKDSISRGSIVLFCFFRWGND
jgi:hypothetical protein